MSKTVSLYSPEAIEPSAFARFIDQIGGFFFEEDHADVGISRAGCHVWIYGVQRALAGSFEEPAEAVEAKLGRKVRVRLDLQLSSEKGSELLALEVARAFAREWHAVATSSVTRVVSCNELDTWVTNQADVSGMLGSGLELMVVSTPLLSEIIPELGGLIVPESGTEQASAQQLADEMNVSVNGAEDHVHGFVFATHAQLCILRPTPCIFTGASNDESDSAKIHQISRSRLSGPPRWHIMLATGWGATKESEQLCFSVARRCLQECEGVAVGLFELVLDVAALDRLRTTGAFVDG
jgi:hypothetical protein